MPEIGADIGQPDAIVGIAFAAPERRARRELAGHERAGAGQLIGRGRGDRQDMKRPRGRLALAHIGDERRPIGLKPRPVAGLHARMNEVAAGIFKARIGRQRLSKGGQRVLMALHLGEHGGERRPGLGIAGRVGDDPLQHFGRFREAPLKRQAVADDKHRLGIAGCVLQRLFGIGDGLAELVLAEEGCRQVGQDGRAVRDQRQGRAQALLGAGMVLRIGALQRLEEEGFRAVGFTGRWRGNGGNPAMRLGHERQSRACLCAATLSQKDGAQERTRTFTACTTRT